MRFCWAEGGVMKTALVRLVVFGLLASALAMSIFLAWPVFDMIRNQITVYSVIEASDGTLIPANRTVYEVLPETRNVTYWLPDVSEVPGRLVKCAVRNRLNWSCESPDGSAALTMEDGLFSEVLRKKARGPKIICTSRLTWWKLYMADKWVELSEKVKRGDFT